MTRPNLRTWRLEILQRLSDQDLEDFYQHASYEENKARRLTSLISAERMRRLGIKAKTKAGAK